MRRIAACLLTAALAACGGSSSTPDAGDDSPDAGDTLPAAYSFPSRFVDGADSVAYTGQVHRQVLILELNAFIGRLEAEIQAGGEPADDATLAALDFYYSYDGSTGATVELTLSAEPGLLQATFGDLGNANLTGKIAGNDDDGTQHVDWDAGIVGWSAGFESAPSPHALVQYWFGLLDDAAATRISAPAEDPDGNQITKVQVTASGLDLQQLIQKFLYGAVNMSQAMDDYLDDATEGKGLLAANTQDGENPYSGLEHGWDEGFGYFGASRFYGDMTDEELASAMPYADENGDAMIDLLREYSFGASTNAAKRDLGAAESAPTDFTAEAWDGFLRGRALLAATEGEIDAGTLAELQAHRDRAVAAWEKAIAATVVHYINDVIEAMNQFETADYSFADHAKAWSELKGFALSFQFNPRSPLSDEDFAELHELLGDHPVLANAGSTAIADYKAELVAARALLGEAYGFHADNLGDANGENGW